jgi:hypothetical protein
MSIIVNNTDGQLNIDNNGILDVYAVRSIKSVSKGVDASGNYYIAINFIANDKNNSLRIYLKDVSSPVAWTNDLTGANAALADIRDWLSEIIEVEISEANDSILVYGFDGANNQPIKTDTNGVLAIQDNGGSITVDGTVSLSAGSLSALESITVQNPGGASAVNIQDGGNSITVDGTVAATQSGTWSVDVQITEANDSIQIYASDGANNVPVLVGKQACGDSLAVTLCTRQAEVQMEAMLIEGNGIVTDNLSNYLSGGSSVYSISFASRGTSYVNISVDGGNTFARLNQGETLSLDANGIMNYYPVGNFHWNSISASASLLIAVNYI